LEHPSTDKLAIDLSASHCVILLVLDKEDDLMPVFFYISYTALWLLVLILSVLVLLLYRHFGLATLGTAEGVQRDGLPIGEKAPPFSGLTVQGELIAWEPSHNHITLLGFISPDCSPCARILPYIKQLEKTKHDIDIVLVTSGPLATITSVVNKFRLPATILSMADDGSGAADTYRVRVSPFAFVIGKDRQILGKGLCDRPERLQTLLEAGGVDAVDFLEVTTNVTPTEV